MFPLHFLYRASRCAIRFQRNYTKRLLCPIASLCHQAVGISGPFTTPSLLDIHGRISFSCLHSGFWNTCPVLGLGILAVRMDQLSHTEARMVLEKWKTQYPYLCTKRDRHDLWGRVAVGLALLPSIFSNIYFRHWRRLVSKCLPHSGDFFRICHKNRHVCVGIYCIFGAAMFRPEFDARLCSRALRSGLMHKANNNIDYQAYFKYTAAYCGIGLDLCTSVCVDGFTISKILHTRSWKQSPKPNRLTFWGRNYFFFNFSTPCI